MNLKNRVIRLERSATGRYYVSRFLKFGRLDEYPDGYIHKGPTVESCRRFGRANIEAIKIEREARSVGCVIHRIIRQIV